MAATVNRKYLPFRWLGTDLTLNMANAPWLSKVIKIIGYTAPSSTGLNSQSGYLGGYNGTTPGGTLQKLVQNADYLLIAGNTSGWSLPDAIEVFNILAGSGGISSMTNKEWFTTNVFTLHERASDIVFVAVDGIVQVPQGATGLGDYSLTTPASGPQTVTVPVPTGATPLLYQVCYFPATGTGGYVTPGDVPVVSAGSTPANTRPWVRITQVKTTNNDVLFTVTSGNTSAGIKCSINGLDFGGVGQVSFPGQNNGYYDSLTAELVDKSARDVWPLTVTLPSTATTIRPGSAGTMPPTTTPTTPAAPTITGFSPGSGLVGNIVTVTGTNLSDVTAVRLNLSAASFSVLSATQLTFTVPTGATTGSISVTTPSGTATSASFTVTPASTGGGGTPAPSVTITGVLVENNRVTITATEQNTSLGIEYSLDGINFQSAGKNVFNAVSNGTYNNVTVRLQGGSASYKWPNSVVVNYTPATAPLVYTGMVPQFSSAVGVVFTQDGENLYVAKKEAGNNTGKFDAYFYGDHMIGDTGAAGLQGKFEADGQVLDNSMNTTVIGLSSTKCTDVNALERAIYFNAGEFGILEKGQFVYGPTTFPAGSGAAGFEIHDYSDHTDYVLAYSGSDNINRTLTAYTNPTAPIHPAIPQVFITDSTTIARKLKFTAVNSLSTPA